MRPLMRKNLALIVLGVADLLTELAGRLLPEDSYPAFKTNRDLDG